MTSQEYTSNKYLDKKNWPTELCVHCGQKYGTHTAKAGHCYANGASYGPLLETVYTMPSEASTSTYRTMTVEEAKALVSTADYSMTGYPKAPCIHCGMI